MSYSVAILPEEVATSAATQDQEEGIGLDACDLFSAASSTVAADEPHAAEDDDAALRVGQVPHAHVHIPIGSSLEVVVTLDLSQLLLPDVVALGELLSGAPIRTEHLAGTGGEASRVGAGDGIGIGIGGDAKRARTEVETAGGSLPSDERAGSSKARPHRSCLVGAALRAMPPTAGSSPQHSGPAGPAGLAPRPDPGCGLQPAVDRFLGLVVRRLHADATACLRDVIEAAGKLSPRQAGDAVSPAASKGSTVPQPLLAEPGSSGSAYTSALGRPGTHAPLSSVQAGTAAARASRGAGSGPGPRAGSASSSELAVASIDEPRVCILCFGEIDERSTAGSGECLQCRQCHSWMHAEHLQVWLEANKASTSALGRLKGPCPHCEGLMSIAI